MFEDSLMESQNRLTSPNQRWATALSSTLQCLLAAIVLALPLLRRESLPFPVDAPKIVLPLKPAPAALPRVNSASAVPRPASAPGRLLSHTRIIPTAVHDGPDVPPTTGSISRGMGDASELTSTLGDRTMVTGPRVDVMPAKPALQGAIHISTGVSAGLLLTPIVPVYPRIAIAARVEGEVKVGAIISKSGRIESAHAVSGPMMLRQAALDAIRNAHYSPFLLNGTPTEVETTITVNFKLFS